MPRPQRIEYSGAYYFIQNSGHAGKQIFIEDDDKEVFISLLGEITRTFGVDILAYALLDDHYQLLIHTPKSGLSRAMRHLDGVFTQRYNEQNNSKGHVFKDRYRAVVIDPKQYLGDAVSSIHARPVFLDYCAVATDYMWSSHQAYFDAKKKPFWLNTDLVIRQLGFIKPLALAKLNTLVRKNDGIGFERLIKNHPLVLGSESFQENVFALAKQNQNESRSKEHHQEQAHTAHQILDFVSFAYNVPVPELKRSLSGVANEARNMAAYQLRTVGGMAQKDIARVLNCSSGYTVAKSLERFQSKLGENLKLKTVADRISRDINAKIVRQ